MIAGFLVFALTITPMFAQMDVLTRRDDIFRSGVNAKKQFLLKTASAAGSASYGLFTLTRKSWPSLSMSQTSRFHRQAS